jgi:outer membrane protein assembly factor BamB
MSRSPLEHALWDLGLLDNDRQAAIDALCRGNADVPVTGQVVSVDPVAYRITTGSLAADKERSIPLPRPDGSFVAGTPYGQPAIMLFDDGMKKVGAYPIDEAPAVLLIDGRPCRYTKSFRSQAYLPFGGGAAAMLVPDQGSPYGPVDLLVSPAGDQALALDRGLGTVYHVDLAAGAVRSRIKVRVAGLTGALSAAWLGNRLLVVDGAAEKLIAFDLRDGAIIDAPAAVGAVSSVVASPDGRVLYLFGTRPATRVLAVDADSFEPLWSTPLRGDPFNHLGDPLGLLAISPDGAQLMAVTAFPEPEPGTPVIAFLDVTTGKIVQRLRLQAARRPAAVAFGVPNPCHADVPTVDEAIVQLGYLTATELDQLKEGLGHAEPTEDWPESVVELAELADGDDWRSDTSEPSEFIDLPVEIEPVIAQYLQRAFEQQTGIDVGLDDTAWAKVAAAATEAREQLQTSTGVLVELPDLAPGKAMSVFIGLDQVAEWLEVLAEMDAALSDVLAEMELIQGIEDVPATCPSCDAPLFGSYICPACGHVVISDAALEAIVMGVKPRESLRSDTADPQLFLPPGHMLVPDPARQRVVELDPTGAIIWSLEPERLDPALKSMLQWPVDALRLANDNTLIIDRGGRRVFEVTPTGRPYWEWPASAGRLGEPVRVARSEWGDTYIVDRQSHRIVKADANGQPVPGYGEGIAGIGPGQLCRPSDVQILGDSHLLITDTGNHRVIEVANGQVVWQFGNTAGVFEGGSGSGQTELERPQRAQRLDNGQTLILDTGNHRILLINPDGTLARTHDTIAGDPAMDVTRPLRMAYLPKGHIAFWDQQRMVEIDPQGKIVWAADLAKLDANPRLQPPEPSVETAKQVWHVKALAKDDPDRQAVAAEKAKRRDEGKAARQIWADGDTPGYFVALKAAAKRRSGKSSAGKHWRIDLEVLERLVAQNKVLLRQKSEEALAEKPAPVAKGPTFKSAPPTPPPPSFRTRPAPEEVDLGAAPLPLLLVQRTSSRLVLLGRNQKVLWNWGMTVLKEPNAAVLLPSRQVLVADTGNHRILVVDIESSEVVWQSSPALELQSPHAASRLPDGHLLIADTGNCRILETTTAGSIVWQWQDDNVLKAPVSCERLANGNTLIADQGSHVVIEVDPAGKVVWSYGRTDISSKSPGFLSHPEYASRRASGHTLIVDGRNHRVLDVDPGGTVSWSYDGEGANRLSGPTYALVQGSSVWIAHGGGRQIFEVSRAGEVIWRIDRPI